MPIKSNIDLSLLNSSNINIDRMEDSLKKLMRAKVEFADYYFQSTCHESWQLEDGIIKQASYGIDGGIGVRAVSQGKTGFAYSDDISMESVERLGKIVKSISSKSVENKPKSRVSMAWNNSSGAHQLYSPEEFIDSINANQKIELLKQIDAVARQADSRVTQVNVSLVGVHDRIVVAATDGTLASDSRPLVRLSVSVIAEHNGKREQGSSGGGARVGYSFFDVDDRAIEYAKEAVRQAILKFDAVDAPAGTMEVVLGSGWPGVLLHEAVGHGLEGDFNRKGSSVFSGRIGERVASSVCTIVDDGTLNSRRGSLNIDDEGTPTQCTTLIEEGILKAYINDKLNAQLTGKESTGNGRRQSYAHVPMPRMTNTYMLAGQSSPDEIISSVDRGLYAVNFAGGQVDITSGNFVFSASEAYLIENGKITSPVKGATLIGSGAEVLTKVSMVGNDLALDKGVGTCGKEGQSVPVGVGQPTLKVDELTVGGTDAS